MVQAAARNLINFKEARSNDRYWYKRLGLLLDEIEASNNFELLKLKHDFYCSLLARTSDETLTNDLLSKITDVHSAAEQTMYPYVAHLRERLENKDKTPRDKNRERLFHAWEERFGKLDDPATQEKIAKEIEVLQNFGKPAGKRKGK